MSSLKPNNLDSSRLEKYLMLGDSIMDHKNPCSEMFFEYLQFCIGISLSPEATCIAALGKNKFRLLLDSISQSNNLDDKFLLIGTAVCDLIGIKASAPPLKELRDKISEVVLRILRNSDDLSTGVNYIFVKLESMLEMGIFSDVPNYMDIKNFPNRVRPLDFRGRRMATGSFGNDLSNIPFRCNLAWSLVQQYQEQNSDEDLLK